MRQAYLEIALVYLQSSGLIAMKENNGLELVTETLDPETASAKTDSSRKTKSWKVSGPVAVTHITACLVDNSTCNGQREVGIKGHLLSAQYFFFCFIRMMLQTSHYKHTHYLPHLIVRQC